MYNLTEIDGILFRQCKVKHQGMWFDGLIKEEDYKKQKEEKKENKRPKTERDYYIEKLDTTWRDNVRSIGYCEKCGKGTDLQAHHIFSRRHYDIRWSLKNGVCLCLRCHLYWAHKDIPNFTSWIRCYRGKNEIDLLQANTTKPRKMPTSEIKLLYMSIGK